VSPRVSLKKPNQEPLFHVNQSKHEHQINLSNKEFTKYILKSVMIQTIESLKRSEGATLIKNPKVSPMNKIQENKQKGMKSLKF
jgi:hypothetical protein